MERRGGLMEEEEKRASRAQRKIMRSGCSSDWQLSEQCERDMFVSGYVLSARPRPRPRPVSDLLQNCDLPPPLKLFSPAVAAPDDADGEKKRKPEPDFCVPPGRRRWGDCGELGGNPGLLRALRLSQTRAREAEKQALLATTTNRRTAAMLLEESLRLSAHRRWVAMLEIEISMLQRKGLLREEEGGRDEDAAAAAGATAAAATWCFALALCLGIAGVSFALGRCLL